MGSCRGLPCSGPGNTRLEAGVENVVRLLRRAPHSRHVIHNLDIRRGSEDSRENP